MGLTKEEIKVLKKVGKLVMLLEVDHVGLVIDGVEKLINEYNRIVSTDEYLEVMSGN